MDEILAELQLAVERCKTTFVPRDRRLLEEPARHLNLDLTQLVIRLNDLARGFVLKIYTHIIQADERWSHPEQRVGAFLIEQFWNKQLSGSELREAWQQLMKSSLELKWDGLLRPFLTYPTLQPLRMEIFTVGMHLANILAKSDGLVVPAETNALLSIEKELGNTLGISSTRTDRSSASDFESPLEAPCLIPIDDAEHRKALLENARERLHSLIGLQSIKAQVEELTNFLELQQRRAEMGLPSSSQSLHMVFLGNPGTGKTTVARILADIFRGLGILKRGHLTETDRTGLVAEYAGQTAAKTSRIIDEALDGVLFIDEAYSLVDPSADDPFGREALNTLLKRMEDYRDRLIVVFAGYTEPTEQLLKSNPGLPSRIGIQLAFPDYSPSELMAIYRRLCEEHQYQLRSAAAVRVLRGMIWLHEQRDSHFGNARLVRNAFERTIRKMATRIVPITPVTHELLTCIEEPDIQFPDIPQKIWEQFATTPIKLQLVCPHCSKRLIAWDQNVVTTMGCPKCKSPITLESLSSLSVIRNKDTE